MKVLLWFLQMICVVIYTVFLNFAGFGMFSSATPVLAILLNIVGSIVIAGIFAFFREVLR